MYEYRKLTPEQKRRVVEERRARGFPAHAPPHFQQDDGTFLLTAACYEHVAHMATGDRRKALLDRLFDEATAEGVELLAWVVLPNHYHCLAHAKTFAGLRTMFKHVNGTMSYEWNGADGTRGRRVWYRYSDRAIRSERHYLTTLAYIHYNPVKHGWARSVYEWEESSVHWYLSVYGREWLRELWVRYPVREYGRGWDDVYGS